MGINNERRGLDDIPFLFVPTAQRFRCCWSVHSVQYGKCQSEFLYCSLCFVEWVGRERIDGNALGGERAEVSLEVSQLLIAEWSPMSAVGE